MCNACCAVWADAHWRAPLTLRAAIFWFMLLAAVYAGYRLPLRAVDARGTVAGRCRRTAHYVDFRLPALTPPPAHICRARAQRIAFYIGFLLFYRALLRFSPWLDSVLLPRCGGCEPAPLRTRCRSRHAFQLSSLCRAPLPAFCRGSLVTYGWCPWFWLLVCLGSGFSYLTACNTSSLPPLPSPGR